jgi:hypothetical protein
MNKRYAGRRASLGQILCSDRIDAMSYLHFRFRTVDGRIGRTIDHHAAGLDGAFHRAQVGDIAFGTPQRDVGNARLPCPPSKCPPNLPLRSENQ